MTDKKASTALAAAGAAAAFAAVSAGAAIRACRCLLAGAEGARPLPEPSAGVAPAELSARRCTPPDRC
ncbi:hypothetical protein ACIQOW_09065 [Kitasatospora sp. NPDC091335]|uniref:hypothetical protein n=1 Tax=Streptomycetaceae TaxID=2062 RepID=UPI001661EA3E|nr:hypothetical protein [Streptomyces sp. CBMA156]